jgi:hypothetical protein
MKAMKYVIEIPTVEALETLTAAAHRRGQKWMLDSIAAKMENRAALGFEDYTQEVSGCPYAIDQGDVNEVQNTLREMGYNTSYYPRKAQLVVEWSVKARKDLQTLKDNNCAWRFPTRAERAKREAELNEILSR